LREMARRVGISASALSQIETGKAQPSVSKLFDIVNLLGVSVDGLLAGHDGPQVVVGRGHEGFFSLQRADDHETLELESGVLWRRLTAGSFPGVEFLQGATGPGGVSSRRRRRRPRAPGVVAGGLWAPPPRGSFPGGQVPPGEYRPGACSSSD